MKSPPGAHSPPGMPYLSSEHVISNVLKEGGAGNLLFPCLGQEDEEPDPTACSLWFSYLGVPH